MSERGGAMDEVRVDLTGQIAPGAVAGPGGGPQWLSTRRANAMTNHPKTVKN